MIVSTDNQEANTVAVTIENGVAWVALNRPEKRNCMNPALNRQMMRVLDELEYSDDVAVLVLTGEGTSWSAGMDLKEYFRETDNDPDAQFRSFTSNKHWSWDIYCSLNKLNRTCGFAVVG